MIQMANVMLTVSSCMRADPHLPAPSADTAGAAAAPARAAAAVVAPSGRRLRAHAAAHAPRGGPRAPRAPQLPRNSPAAARLRRRPLRPPLAGPPAHTGGNFFFQLEVKSFDSRLHVCARAFARSLCFF